MKNIHVLPTKKPSRLGYLTKKGKEVFKDLRLFDRLMPIILDSENQNIYITSDEEIKEGDYCISHLNIIDEGKIHNSQTIFNPKTKEHLSLLKSCKKIILTTAPDLIKDGVQAIDDEFLEWFVKNPSCEWVEVRYEVLKPFQSIDKGYILHLPDNEVLEEPKQDWLLNNPQCKQIESCSKSLSKKCICPKEKPKQEKLEEAYLNKLIDDANKEFTLDRKLAKEVAIKYTEWQAQRMGLMEIELNHTKTLLASCEQTLEQRDRDRQSEKLKAQIEVLEFAEECIEIALFKDGLEEYSDSYYELIEIENKLAEKRQQLNALTNEN
jgi:hypothetical protein